METTTYTPPHPVVFVFDPSNDSMVVPEYKSDAVVSANNSCVSIRTITDVDGDVTVTLAGALPQEIIGNSMEVFHGNIDTPGRKVALVTSENQQLLELDVKGLRAFVRVLVDDEMYPTRLWVESR